MFNFQFCDYYNLWGCQNLITQAPIITNDAVLFSPETTNPVPDEIPKDIFKCEVCKKAFKSKHNLISHKKNIHEQVFKVNCSKCGLRFANKYTLKKHSVKMHPPKVEIS